MLKCTHGSTDIGTRPGCSLSTRPSFDKYSVSSRVSVESIYCGAIGKKSRVCARVYGRF